ncbi:DUF883 family protein [Variovorax sp. JS1663]|uniref:DUF883 family protein n=1 Tax=Variovorax sp. JS1663 TaxID=1851577 RepID=UPI000B345773|nr:DUF883 family protein [Variovorax sp. JS1663]OUM00914.1 hypothetical protein A8M77_18580 [Variovorax sp. JS1663]
MNDTLQAESVNSAPVSGDHQACMASSRMGDTRARLEDALRGMRTHFGDIQDTTVHRARDALRSADTAVHQHPYGVLAAIAVTGLLVGYLTGRR